MANVSKHLQPPGTGNVDEHEKMLSTKDLFETLAEEKKTSAACKLYTGLGLGIILGEAFVLTISSPSPSLSEYSVRIAIEVASGLVAVVSLLHSYKSDNHADRALELLRGEIGERPSQGSAAPANNLQ